MALVLADRVKETTTVAGTGTATLLGAVSGYQSFAAVGNGNTCYYCIAHQTATEWEVGVGTYTSAGTTLARTTVLASSNAGAAVTFSAGTKDVFVTYPATKTINADITQFATEVMLAPGTTTYAPLIFSAGTLQTTPLAGDFEFDGDVFYGTVGSNNRGVIPAEYFVVLQSNNTLISQTAAQPLFDGGGTGLTNGAISLGTGTFFFECAYYLTSLSATSGSFGFALGGTATKTYQYEAAGKKSTLATAAAGSMTFNTGPNTTLVAASTTNTGYVKITGTVDITVAGTIIPQVSLTIAAAAVVNTGSYFRIRRMGSSTIATMGNWS